MTEAHDEYALGEVGECPQCEQRYLFSQTDEERHCLTDGCKGTLTVVYRYMLETREKAEKLMNELADLCNGGRMSDIAKGIEKGVARQHRTLQQQMFSAMLVAMRHWAAQAAKGPGYYDARNEYTVKTAKRIMELVDNSVHVPLI